MSSYTFFESMSKLTSRRRCRRRKVELVWHTFYVLGLLSSPLSEEIISLPETELLETALSGTGSSAVAAVSICFCDWRRLHLTYKSKIINILVAYLKRNWERGNKLKHEFWTQWMFCIVLIISLNKILEENNFLNLRRSSLTATAI